MLHPHHPTVSQGVSAHLKGQPSHAQPCDGCLTEQLQVVDGQDGHRPHGTPAHFYVAGDRQDVFGFARTWKAVKGEDLELVSLGSVDDLAAETYRRLQATPHDMYACLPLMYARGVFGGQALLGDTLNARYPDIAAEDLAAAMGRGAV